MTRHWPRLLLIVSPLALGGCVASMAASAVGMAVQSARPEPQSNQHLQPAAREACTAQAAQHGTVHIIDVEQRSLSKIVVWGTVDDGQERRSFECGYRTQITDFELRAIRARP